MLGSPAAFVKQGGNAHPDRRQQLQRRHDGVGRHPAGTTSSLQGNILNNATVGFDQSANGTYAGVMSGTGSPAQAGTGTLILTGANTYTGGTTVSGGILQGTTTSLQGNIVNNADGDVQPSRHRHLCRQHVGHRRPR